MLFVRSSVKSCYGVVKNKAISQNFLMQKTKVMYRMWQPTWNIHGVKGMARCFDCMHVHWKNCLYSLHGQHVGKDGVPTMVIETSCHYKQFFVIMNLACGSIKWLEYFGFQSIVWIFSGKNNCINRLWLWDWQKTTLRVVFYGGWDSSWTLLFYENNFSFGDESKFEKCQELVRKNIKKGLSVLSKIQIHANTSAVTFCFLCCQTVYLIR